MIDEYIRAHKNYGIILDTNVFLLYLIGVYDINFIKDFKRTVKYDIEDFEWLKLVIKPFKSIYVTPQILAEAWNLFENIRDPKFSDFLDSTLHIFTLIDEEYINKNDIVQNSSLRHIGVTDTSIIEVAMNLNLLVITDDFRSVHHYMSRDISVLNINQLKSRYL